MYKNINISKTKDQIPEQEMKYPIISYVDTTPWKNWRDFRFLLHD